jgi:hypothetical protein
MGIWMITFSRWIFLMFAVTALIGCAGTGREVQNTEAAGRQAPAPWESNGIEVVRIKPAVNGMMLDLRYRVTDTEKARKLIKETTNLFLVDQASGAVLPVPNMAKVGRLRNIPGADGKNRVYWMFFKNPGGRVQPGSKVTLIIGNVKIRDIIVE